MQILLVILLIWLAPAVLLAVMLGVSIVRERRAQAASASAMPVGSEKPRDDGENDAPQENGEGDQKEKAPSPQTHAAKVGHEVH